MFDYSNHQNVCRGSRESSRLRGESAGRSQGVMRVEDQQPLLSIVVTARNDDHGGGFLHRMQIFVNGFLELATRYRLSSELIIVEWNPPRDRPRLAEALRWPATAGPCAIRIIEVPPAVHRRYSYSGKLGLFQMIAKNVGIRRSRGSFVLCTNVDLLFSGELMQFFASGRLDKRCMYRIDRFDVSSDVPVEASIDEQLEFCRSHVVRVNVRWRTLTPDEIGWFAELRKYSKMLAGLVAVAIRAVSWTVVIRAVSWTFSHSLADSVRGFRAAVRTAVRTAVGRIRKLLEHRFMLLHTNACGDFTLLSRDRWFRLRGYPEWHVYSFHLDSILCYMAHYSGAREVVLKGKKRLYHIDHHSGWSPEAADLLATRMSSLGVPMLDYEQLCSHVTAMHMKKSPLIFNDENWGLALEDLAETDPVTGQTGHAEVARSVRQAVRA